MRVKANFGDRPFVYSEGHAHRDAADVPEGESLEEIVALFKELPFHPYDDEEEEGEGGDVPPLPQPIEEGKPPEVKHEPLVTDPQSKELQSPKLPAKGDMIIDMGNLIHSFFVKQLIIIMCQCKCVAIIRLAMCLISH